MSIVTKLKNLPKPFPLQETEELDGFPNCLYYKQDDGANIIFVLTLDNGLLSYNLDQQILIDQHEYPTNLNYAYTLRSPTGCIDTKNDTIYIGMNDLHDSWILFDIKTRNWDINVHFGETPNFVFIPSPINQMYTLCQDWFEKVVPNKLYDPERPLEKYSFSTICLNTNVGQSTFLDNDITLCSQCKFVYNPNKNQLMAIQEYSTDILICDIIMDKDREIYQWSKANIGLPKMIEFWSLFDICLGWNQILFLFYHYQGYVYCIDLKHPEETYLKDSHKDGIRADHMIKDDDNNVHLFQMVNDMDDEIVATHLRVSLHDIIPEAIIRLNQSEWDPLVIGYCKEFESKNKLIYIPQYLKQLILQFYPLFV